MRGLSLVAASGGYSSSWCTGLSLSWPLLLWSTGSRRAGSVVVAHRPSCSAACGIFLDQGSNPCPLHWQADSQQLHHQGSPALGILSLKAEEENARGSCLSHSLFLKKKNKCIYLFIYFWLRWVFVAAHGFSLVVASRGCSSLRCEGFSLRWLLLLAEHRL